MKPMFCPNCQSPMLKTYTRCPRCGESTRSDRHLRLALVSVLALMAVAAFTQVVI